MLIACSKYHSCWRPADSRKQAWYWPNCSDFPCIPVSASKRLTSKPRFCRKNYIFLLVLLGFVFILTSMPDKPTLWLAIWIWKNTSLFYFDFVNSSHYYSSQSLFEYSESLHCTFVFVMINSSHDRSSYARGGCIKARTDISTCIEEWTGTGDCYACREVSPNPDDRCCTWVREWDKRGVFSRFNGNSFKVENL